MANIYQGSGGCYAKKEGVWIPGSGVSAETLPSFIALIMRDLARGWSYDESCNRIAFDTKRAMKRLHYLIALAKKHSGEAAKTYTKKVLDKLFREYRLPGSEKPVLAGYPEQLDKVGMEIEDILGTKVRKMHVGGKKAKALAVATAR
ncbi:hypothetical protein [Thermosphaera sp.]